MVHLSEESYAEFKSICDKEGIHYDTEAEYREAAQNLLSLFEVLYDGASEELARKKRLATEPNGYAIDSNGRTCFVWKCTGRNMVRQMGDEVHELSGSLQEKDLPWLCT